jgi:hypothetical protein
MVETPATSNPEMFANYGVGPTSVRFTRTYTAPDGVTTHVDSPDFLLVVNGKDDDGDGYADNGWDGVDNNGDPQHLIDEPAEWETETWLGTAPVNAAYQILRRPAPTGKPTVLPSSVVVDLTTWASTHERSRCTVDTWTGSASVIVDQYGKVVWDLPYASLASIGMDKAFLHLWLADRSDVGAGGPAGVLASPKEDARLITLNRNGTVTVQVVNPDQPRNAFLRGIRGERD